MTTVSKRSELWLMTKSGLVLPLLVIFIFSVVLMSCAGNAKTKELLAKDYMAMVNDDLQLYYYQLEDQIFAEESKSSGGTVSLGMGRGSYGRHGGVGVSTGSTTQHVATDLRDRRNQVKLELSKRGIDP